MKSQVTSFLNYLREQKHYANNTIAAYQNDLSQFIDFVAVRSATPINDWVEVNAALLTAYIDYLDELHYAQATITRKIATIKSLYNYLNLPISRVLVSKHMVKLRLKRQPPKALSEEEVARLLSIPGQRQTPKAQRDYILLSLLYETGMRVSEAVMLRVDSIDAVNKVVECGEDNRSMRQIPLSEEMIARLQSYLTNSRTQLTKNGNEHALFVNHRGSPLTRQGLWLIIKSHAQTAGLETPVTPNILRHSFAVRFLKRGGSVQELQKLLGHANLATTQIYILNPGGDNTPPSDNGDRA
ncbi:MAG: tyrosine-type recombinase/integrase [Anaerolineae bacterium]|nr:tyrosine-type recombinase/integrase [Anaerolineae bacterium]